MKEWKNLLFVFNFLVQRFELFPLEQQHSNYKDGEH